MKLSVQYLNDPSGQLRAIQLPISDWGKLMNRLTKYEQILKLKSDLTEAFSEVKKMRSGKLKKQSLSDFLKEL